MASGDAGGGRAVEPRAPRAGEVLAERYRLVRSLEDCAGGVRYEALNTLDGRVVDVDLRRADTASAAVVARFLEEARTVARIGHDNVVQIFNGGRTPDGDVFLALEHLEGTDLAHVLAVEPPLPWERAQSLLLQVASALGALHAHGLVHGNLRPDGVRLVARDGRRDVVKLRDVGVARLGADGGQAHGEAQGEAHGVAQGVAHDDPRHDVRALGRLAYQLVTGAIPLEPPAPPTSLRPGGTLPAELDGVLLRALEIEPARRWPDMAAFAEALTRCRLTRRQSVRVEALVAAERAGNRSASGAFEAATQRRHRAWSVVSVVVAVVIASLGLRLLTNAPGHVLITTSPADAELVFDGMAIRARSPVALDVAPGHHRLGVSHAGFVTATRAVDVTARATLDVTVELPPVNLTPPTPAGAP